MALVACRECGQQVSTSAPKCPHCGILTPSATQHKTNALAMWGCAGAALLFPILFLAWCSSITPDPPEPGVAASRRYETNSSNVTPESFEAVAAVLESQPGVRVERDPAAPATMRIHIDRYDVTERQAQQLGTMAVSRLGEDAVVYVYDASGLRLARVTAFGAGR